jgi:hypothetical protein
MLLLLARVSALHYWAPVQKALPGWLIGPGLCLTQLCVCGRPSWARIPDGPPAAFKEWFSTILRLRNHRTWIILSTMRGLKNASET